MAELYPAPARDGNWHLMPGWRSSSPFQILTSRYRKEASKIVRKKFTVGRCDECFDGAAAMSSPFAGV